MSWLSDAWDAVSDTVSDGLAAVNDAVSAGAEAVADAAEEFVEDVKDTWSDATSDISAAFEDGGPISGIIAVGGAILTGVVGTVGNVVDAAVDLAGAVAGTAVGVAGAVIGTAVRLSIAVVSLGVLSDLAEDFGRLITETGRGFADLLIQASDFVGDAIERIFDIAAHYIKIIIRKIRCWFQQSFNVFRGMVSWIGRRISGETVASPYGARKIQHFFVLTLENRSFDHLLGLSTTNGIDGIDSINHRNMSSSGLVPATAGARLVLRADPPHEFSHVQTQLSTVASIPNGGFVTAFEQHMGASRPEDPTQVMKAFTADELPILHTLAAEFATCDSWFSSVPGPTLPNRLFAMAATSGGLADSPRNESLVAAMTVGAFDFEHGNLFERLDIKCVHWRVYTGDNTPLVLTLKGVVTQDVANGWRRIRDYEDFYRDLLVAPEDFPPFIWLEPNYGKFWDDFTGGNSQHPIDNVAAGEALIKRTYEAIRNSPLWESSALVILYDEHGGFYDHREPPPAVPPEDKRLYEHWAEDTHARQFEFDRLGFRVPAIIISPFVERGYVDHRRYDHTSLVATLAERFDFKPLTRRDATALTFGRLFSLDQPRADAPRTLPAVYWG